MISAKALSRAEEGIITDILCAEKSLKISKQFKLDKKTLIWQEKEIKELKKSLKEIRNAKEKTLNHEIKIKANKQRKEWLKKHPHKTLIDYHETITIPRFKKLDEKIKRERH